MSPLQARKLHLLPSSSPSSPSSAAAVSHLLFETSSHSLALMLSDSSALLFPSLLPLIPSPPPRPTAVHSPFAAAAAFARALPSPSSPPHPLFLAASPAASAAGAGTSVLLRAWALPPCGARHFSPVPLSFKRCSPSPTTSLTLDTLPFGLGVRLAGAANIVVLHSIAAAQIWVLTIKLLEGEAGTTAFHLTKCAVVEVFLPIYSISVVAGFMILGEVGGVRVFPLRPLIKGQAVKRAGDLVGQKSSSVCELVNSSCGGCKKKGILNGVVIPLSCGKSNMAGKALGRDRSVVQNHADPALGIMLPADKLITLKVKQNSGNYCSFFVGMNCAEVQNRSSDMGALVSVKAVSIHALIKNMFLILDSAGDLHVLSLHIDTSEITDRCSITSTACTYRLNQTIKVQLLAVPPNVSSEQQVVWVSDGGYSVHTISISDFESPASEDVEQERGSHMIQISAVDAIFTSEKVQDIVPLSTDAVAILGQGSIFAYGTA